MKLLYTFVLTIAVATDAVYTDLSSTFAVDLYKEWTDLLVQQFEVSDDKSSASDVVNFPKVISGPVTFIGQTNDKAHSFHSIPYAEALKIPVFRGLLGRQRARPEINQRRPIRKRQLQRETARDGVHPRGGVLRGVEHGEDLRRQVSLQRHQHRGGHFELQAGFFWISVL